MFFPPKFFISEAIFHSSIPIIDIDMGIKDAQEVQVNRRGAMKPAVSCNSLQNFIWV